jgi:GLPGLI family protein
MNHFSFWNLTLLSLALLGLLEGTYLKPYVPAYRVRYQLVYRPDSTNQQRLMQEELVLFLDGQGHSTCAAAPHFQRDSVSALVKAGKLSEYDILGDPKNRFRYRFAPWVRKSYTDQSLRVHETIGIQSYTYLVPNQLQWELTTEQDTLAGYACLKATTRYAGRTYEAWFTPDIPLPDGPYVFWGLPGLIVKIGDTRGQYVFTLTEFRPHAGPIPVTPTYRKRPPIETARNNAFALREEARKDPERALRRAGLSLDRMTVQEHGSSESRPARSALVDRSWDNNPLELQ